MEVKRGFVTGLRVLIVSCCLLLTGLLFVRFVGRNTRSESPYASGKVNLALRRTAHHLLRAAGDSTSKIPAVQQINSNTYQIQLGPTFDYDQLPGLLQASLKLHNITSDYDVAVLDCERGEFQLGYSFSDLLNGNSIPCVGRAISAGCYVLQVAFNASPPADQRVPIWPIITLSGMLVGLLVVSWSQKEGSVEVNSSAPLPTVNPSLLYFGRSSLDVANLMLVANKDQHKLTYREAKLLNLLVSHPNQVLERDQILKLVWEDEGIIVGRSVDVFISRLRKLLQPDTTVKIAAVHGVGYRLEIEVNSIGAIGSEKR
ncbi:winged helix-turn-helix domain-containing protein [Spirosoma aerophilum]